ncbi:MULTISPECIES: RHS repeat domain-containing protein [unclassified Pseudomonas]|jgi:insecticidal toxin complex protein TccC|uniref:RHS repeat domain-containing protein n=1 Tax=unclassified Pseudomonas TaxID=196821 RepID=UPI0002707584|nr:MULTISPECIES: RHS repeat-associated core domain-containing protein [unclassified Pseudomonas]EJM78643.1 RHS repeat-associated core domain protein-containing protein [Pseudomonas sp. GM67]MBD9548838.1 RHS repeat protein [Pseudomonas sp. PDM01]
MPSSIHRFTPTLTVIDPRRLLMATVDYHRMKVDEPTQARTERQVHDAAGRVRAQWDARLWALGGESEVPNQRKTHSLSGQVLSLESVDAGWRVSLLGTDAQLLENWDGRSTCRQTTYDSHLRAVTVHEHLLDDVPACVERFTYGIPADTGNRCGRLIRHDDPAGTQVFVDYGVLGQAVAQTQQFLKDLAPPNWPALLQERDVLLEVGAPYLTRWRHDAVGAVIRQIDAVGNEQLNRYNIAGQLALSSLTPEGEAKQVVVADIRYNASGQMESQTAGNRVTSQATYAADNGRLLRLHAARPDKVLQDLHFVQDPVGNVLSVEDQAQPTQWFDSQQIDPVSTYRYDTLNHLIQATGRESVLAAIQPGLPELVVPGSGDASRLRNYKQSYTYDAAGNLLTLKHGEAPLRTMKVALRSNRSLYMVDEANPPDLDKGFDANGNMLLLDGAQTMAWDARNQLQRVTQVVRNDGANDDEVYIYHGDGQRARKVSVQQAKAVEHVAQVLYLPGLEIRRDTAKGEELYVATVQAGRSRMRRLHWRANGRKALPVTQSRYNVDDHLGSCALELDEQGEVISHEGYYPFGGSAWWAAKSQAHANGKTIRYSGKERDATGLYYYGLRYYAPWLNRWINPDPAGDVDGLNLYRMVRNNPLRFRDGDGRLPEDVDDYSEDSPSAGVPGYQQNPKAFRRRDLDEHTAAASQKVVVSTLSHTVYREHSIVSTYTDSSIPRKYRFKNEYLPGRWRIMEVFRAPVMNGPNATDVTWHQYEQVSRQNNFYGVLPKVIVHWEVINIEALRATQAPEGMLERFLASEGNGRFTQRVMNAFGLRATGIERREVHDYRKGADINIIAVHVEPIPQPRSPSLEALTREVERDLRRMSRNPVSRVAHSVWRSLKRTALRSPSRQVLS